MANNQEDNSGVIKLAVGVIAVMAVCFYLGYFVIGKSLGRGTGTGENGVSPVSSSPSPGTDVVARTTSTARPGTLTIIDNTAEVEAKRKKAMEDARKKADEEAKKKADDAAKLLAEQEQKENVSPSPTASVKAPDPDDLPLSGSPVPDESPIVEETPVVTETPQPLPSPTPKPVAPKPSPVASPASTPDDPEDHVAAEAPAGTGNTSAAATVSGPLYRVRVGTFADKANADTLAADLKSHGYATSLSTEMVGGKTVYRLQVGAYRNEKTARDFAKELEASGYKTTITHH